MPWKKSVAHAAQLAFVREAREKGGSFAAACRRHGISRKTGYKWRYRYDLQGREGLRARSSRSRRQWGSYPASVHRVVARLRRRYPWWGAKKLRCLLQQRWPRRRWPCVRTMERWVPRRPRPHRARPGPVLLAPPRSRPRAANDLWTVDFKGWVRTADRKLIEPLTVRDAYSCYVLSVAHVSHLSFRALRRAFSALFRKSGLPKAIRVDNGTPFGGNHGPRGLSRLAVWWWRLGIRTEYIRPGHPQDNGAHEQMHRVLKNETLKPPAATPKLQHQAFRAWQERYNHVRPHETLLMRVPAHFYRISSRAFCARLPILTYPPAFTVRKVSARGFISWQQRRRFIGKSFGGELIGLRPHAHHQSIFLGSLLLGLLYPDDPGGIRPVSYASASSR